MLYLLHGRRPSGHFLRSGNTQAETERQKMRGMPPVQAGLFEKSDWRGEKGNQPEGITGVTGATVTGENFRSGTKYEPSNQTMNWMPSLTNTVNEKSPTNHHSTFWYTASGC